MHKESTRTDEYNWSKRYTRGINSRLDDIEEWTRDSEDKSSENNGSWKEKKCEKNEIEV